MDPSSPYAMQRLIGLKDRFDVAFACDTDHDRHGIVTRSVRVCCRRIIISRRAIDYLFTHRPQWSAPSGGRQDGGEQQHDRSRRPRSSGGDSARCLSVSSGSWTDCRTGSLGFAGEESAGATFAAARRDRVDDRQGRHHRSSARRGNHRTGTATIRGSCTVDSRAISAIRCTSGSRRRPARRRNGCSRHCQRPISTAPSWRVSRFKTCSRSRQATSSRSAGSKWSAPTGGLPRDRPERNRSTRSTQRVSEVKRICSELKLTLARLLRRRSRGAETRRISRRTDDEQSSGHWAHG